MDIDDTIERRWGKRITARGIYREERCKDTSAQPSQILHWFRQHGQLEVNFAEVRAHLGVETRATVV